MADNSVFITVTTYDAFYKIVKAFAKGTIPLLLIVGEPGTSKSKSVKQALGGKGKWIEGKATAVAVYALLYEYRDHCVIFDDVDAMYADDAFRRLLKCLCQSDMIKTLNWHSQNKVLREAGVPSEFQTTSHVCIIVNEWKTLSQDVKAIEDRAVAVRFEPTAAEVHREVAKWFDDQEVYDHIGSIAHLIANPSMRHYLVARSMKRSNLDWRALSLERCCDRDIVNMHKILSDEKLTSEAMRVKVWVKAKFGSRAKFFRVKKRMARPENMPSYRVKGKPERKPRKKVSKSHEVSAAHGLKIVGQ